jgi:hypothetical protein
MKNEIETSLPVGSDALVLPLPGFTPGPWMARDNRDGFGSEVLITTKKRKAGSWSPICELNEDFTGTMGPEQVANKHLIVAAPDLLECLIHLADRDWFQSGMTGEVICGLDAEKVRNALSKALGQNVTTQTPT